MLGLSYKQTVNLTLLGLLTLGVSLWDCGGGGGQKQRDIDAVMKVYDQDPQKFRHKLNRPYPD